MADFAYPHVTGLLLATWLDWLLHVIVLLPFTSIHITCKGHDSSCIANRRIGRYKVYKYFIPPPPLFPFSVTIFTKILIWHATFINIYKDLTLLCFEHKCFKPWITIWSPFLLNRKYYEESHFHVRWCRQSINKLSTNFSDISFRFHFFQLIITSFFCLIDCKCLSISHFHFKNKDDILV